MANTRLTDEEVNRDEFAEGVHSLVVYVQNNYIKIIVLVVLLLVALLTWQSVQARNERLAQEVNKNINEAMLQLNAIESQPDPEQRAMQATTLAKGLDDVLTKYPDQPLATQAYFLKGKTLFAADRFEEAQKSYQQYVDRTKDPEDKARGEMALGYTYENQAFVTTNTQQQKVLLSAALSSYEGASQAMPGSYIAAYATMGEARVHEALGDKEKAIALYDKVVKSRPAPSTSQARPASDGKKEAEMTRMLRQQIDRMELQISFEKTAELRLASLRGTTGTLTQAEAPR